MSVAAGAAGAAPFNRRTVFWGICASLLAAAGFFLLSTYAPDFRIGTSGGTSALSKSGTGFAGLALTGLLEADGFFARHARAAEAQPAGRAAIAGPLAPKPPHLRTNARSVIF